MQDDFSERTRRFVDSFFGTSDLVEKEIPTSGRPMRLFFLDAMTDASQVDLSVLRPLVSFGQEASFADVQKVVTAGCTVKEADFSTAVASVGAGDAVLLSPNNLSPIVFGVRKGTSRAVTEPPTSPVVKGPREGFVEDLKTNMVLLRRRIRSNKLVFESIKIGRFTETTVVLAYVRGIVKKEIVDKIRDRLNAVRTDGIVDSSAVEKILEERPYSLFNQLGNTEKPDVAATKLLNGRVAILVDGSPIAVTAPFLLVEDLQVPQDAYYRNVRATFLRLLRVFSLFFALVLPSSYVAVQTHQYQILPLPLLTTILNASSGIPFTPTLEMLIALVFFELLSEASVRMPRHVGMALSVVGAIVLGETAVKAGLLSSVTVLVVAISGIAIYTLPDEVGVLSVLRMLLVVVGGLFGIYGILLFFLLTVGYLTALDCYGVPYLAPYAPIEDENLRKTLLAGNVTDLPRRSTISIANGIRFGRNA